MYFLNTDMHMVTFTITMFEVVMLVFQIIYFLQRPNDKSRLQYLILLLCLIAHNICSGLFPDEQFLIPVKVQMIVAYLVGFLMSMYVIYYFYKVFELKELKFFATYGLLFFLFLPFVFLFVVPYLLTGDDRLSAHLTVVIPFLYAIGFIYYTARALILKFKHSKKEGKAIDDPLYEHAIAAFISLICWASLPVIVFFGDFQVLEHSVTNAGFLMMTVIYVRSSIKQSRLEYVKLLQSESNLQQLNRELKRKVRKRTRKLEELIEIRKTTFINLAHETKTPLTLINNYLDEYIQKNGESKEMNVIKNNIDRLTTDMLNFFDVESYEKGLSIYNHNHATNISDLLTLKLALFEVVAKKKGQQFKYLVQPGLQAEIHPGAWDRIANNLIENAIKYSGENGKVAILLRVQEDCITFSVVNSGDPIPPDFHKRIFDPYFKLSMAGKKSDGMGMGLSIVKRIVEDLKGEIDLQSDSHYGTTVSVKLPLLKELELRSEDVSSVIDSSFFAQTKEETEIKPTVLLVEDNSEMSSFIFGKLSSNYRVLLAPNGVQALKDLENISCLDLIISDVMMSDMDGFEFCGKVLASEKFRHIPFIFLTAKVSTDNRIKGLQLGALDYIEKPFKIQELMFKIDSILSNLKKQREALINQAYRAILSDSIQKDKSKSLRDAFVENCEKFHLTSREAEIVRQLSTGLPYKIIGDNLNISDKTVAKHISNIFAKVGATNKVELIKKLEFNELVDMTP